ncbi:MAG: hypothetical protein ABL930_05620 [Pseudobdellovibrio sp.]
MSVTAKVLTTALLLVSFQLNAQTVTANSNESFFSKNQKFDNEGVELYSSNLELKKHKKFGVGLSLGGSSGQLGLSGELNLDPENALVIGLGTGPSYGTFNLLYKYNYEAKYISPYAKFGYSKWFKASNNSTSAQTSDVLKSIYSDKDLKAGNFDADFFVSGLGAEYNQLEGQLSGVNFYGEVVLLTEIKSAKMVPTGAVGLIYFY